MPPTAYTEDLVSIDPRLERPILAEFALQDRRDPRNRRTQASARALAARRATRTRAPGCAGYLAGVLAAGDSLVGLTMLATVGRG